MSRIGSDTGNPKMQNWLPVQGPADTVGCVHAPDAAFGLASAMDAC